jgi:ATP-dependent protease HslVU (ClpYQ) peptidase subunit
MSVVIAVRAEGVIAIAADSLSVTGPIARATTERKVHVQGGVFISMTGEGEAPEQLRRHIVEAMRGWDDQWLEKWNYICTEGPQSAVLRALAEGHPESPAIVIWGGRIFQAWPEGTVIEFLDDVVALGSGGEIAMGAAYALLDEGIELPDRRHHLASEIAVRAVAIACKLHIYCGGSVWSDYVPAAQGGDQ